MRAIWLSVALLGFTDGLMISTLRPMSCHARCTPSLMQAEASEGGDRTPAEVKDEAARDIMDGDFMRWYRMEKRREEFEKANPNWKLEAARDKLAGYVPTAFFLGLGYYGVPKLIEVVKDAMEK